MTKSTTSTPQSEPLNSEERIAMPEHESLTSEQRSIVESLTNGPRKGVVGPFIPLMHAPNLLNLMEPLGAELRFRGRLSQRIRELVICAVARHTSNQFEWNVHASLALDAGVLQSTLAALLEGRVSASCPVDERVALEFTQRLMSTHGVPDSLFDEIRSFLGEDEIVELCTLVGYFVTVCWIMNVARTSSSEDVDVGVVRRAN